MYDMRVLLLHKFHHKLGGAERIYFETAELLRQAGHEVAFFSMRHPENEETPWSKYFVEEVTYDDAGKNLLEKLRIAGRILWNREATKNLSQLIDDFQPDVAHAFNVFHQLSPAIFHVLKKKKVPIVMTLCDFKVISPNYFLYHFGKRRIWESTSGFRCIWEKAVKNSYAKSLVCALELWLHRLLKSYERVDTFLAPSRFLIDKYHELGFSKEISLVHHPVHTQSSLPEEKRGKDYVYFGRLSPEKGVDVAIRAMEGLPTKELFIIGYGPAQDELEKLVEELGLAARVHFLGPLYKEALYARLSEAEAILFPAVWYENQPFAMMDALGSGVPLVASRIGGIPDIIKHGENGFLFEAGNPEDLRRVLQELSRFSREEIVRRAKETSAAYTAERYRDELLRAYKVIEG